MIEASDRFTFIQLDNEARRRADQASFHFVSEGEVRGQVLNFRAGTVHPPHRIGLVTVLTGISGEITVVACERSFSLRSLGQLVLLPDIDYEIRAVTDSACQRLHVPLAGSPTWVAAGRSHQSNPAK